MMSAKRRVYAQSVADTRRGKDVQSALSVRSEQTEPQRSTAEKGAPSAADYDRVYECTTAGLGLANAPESRLKEEIFREFNIDKPADFKGHSLSISDVVVLDGAAYYVDVYGFKQVKNFKEDIKNDT